MAAPQEINPIDLLSEDDRKFYNSLKSSKAKEGFLGQRVREGISTIKTAQALGEEIPNVGSIIFQPATKQLPPPPSSLTEAEAGAAPSDFAFGEGSFESEPERLKREAEAIRKSITEDEIIEPNLPPEDAGLPPVEAAAPGMFGPLEDQKRFTPITSERAKAGEKILAPSPDGLAPATPVQEFRAKLKDDEVSAWNSFKDELLSKGSSLEEAEAQASQLVAAIVLSPREIGNYSEKVPDGKPIDKEKFTTGESGFAEAFKRQPLESTSAFKFRESREGRGSATRKIIEDQVVSDLIKWQDNKLPNATGNYWSDMKDTSAGGIDQQKVDKWKKDRFNKRVFDQESQIRVKTLSLLLNGEKAKGAEVAEGSEEYNKLKQYAYEIGNMWLEETAPDLFKARNVPVFLTSGAQDLLREVTTTAPEEGQLFETKAGAGLRDISGLIRFVTDPIIAGLTYDVKGDGTPVDTNDTNYLIDKGMKEAYIAINKGEGSVADYAQKYNPLAYLLGAGREVGSGITGRDELSSGNYLSDVAYAIAIGRSMGDDFSDLPATQYFYENSVPEALGGGKGSLWPFMFGLGVEIALPILPTTAVGAAVKGVPAFGKTFGLAPLINAVGGTEIATYVALAGDIIESPFTKTAGPLARRTIEIGKARDIAKAFEVKPPSYLKLFSTKPVAEVLTQTIAPKVADIIKNGGKLPSDFGSIVKEVELANKLIEDTATDFDSILREVTSLVASPYGNYIARAIANSSVTIINEAIKTAKVAGDSAIQLQPYYDALRYAKIISRTSTSGVVSSEQLVRFLQDIRGLSEWTVDLEDTIMGQIKIKVGDMVVADRVADILAKSNYNDWLFITPTMIVKNSAWEKSGKEVDNLVKETIFGTSNEKDVAKIVKEMVAGEGVTIDGAQTEAVIKRLSGELGPKVSDLKYWQDIVAKIYNEEALTIEEFNAVNDIMRASSARELMKGSEVLNPRATSKLTEKAAVPIVRRSELGRAIGDTVRATGKTIYQIPGFESTISKISSTKIGKAIYKYTGKIVGLIPSKAITTEGISLPLFNALQKVGAQVNNLPAELIQEFRVALAGKAVDPAEVFAEIVDKYVTSKINVTEQGLMRADDVANLYWDMTRRFFSLPELSQFKLNETFLAKNGPIYSILERRLGIDEQGFLTNSIGGTAAGSGILGTRVAEMVKGRRSLTVDIFEEIINEVRATNPYLETKGAKLVTADAIADIFIGKILDAKKDILIENFAAEMLGKNPELIYTYDRANAIAIAREAAGITGDVAETAATRYGEILGTVPPGEKWGKPVGVGTRTVIDEDGVSETLEIVTRDTKGLITERGVATSYDILVQPLINQAVSEVIKTMFDAKAWDKIAEEAYFKVTNTIISKGLANPAEIEELLTKYFNETFKFDDKVPAIQKYLKDNYPAVDFDEYMGRTVQQTPKLNRKEYKNLFETIIADPAKFTDDPTVVAAINKANAEIEKPTNGFRQTIADNPADYMSGDFLREFDTYRLIINDLKEGGRKAQALPQLIIEGRVKAPTPEIDALVKARISSAYNTAEAAAADQRLLDEIQDWTSKTGDNGKAYSAGLVKEANGNVKALLDLVIEDLVDSTRALAVERRSLVAQIIEKGQIEKTTTGFRFKRSAYTQKVIEQSGTAFTQGMIENALQLSTNNVIAKMIGLGFDFKVTSGGFEAVNISIDNLNGIKLFLDADSFKFLNAMTEGNLYVNAGLEDLKLANGPAADFWASRIGWMAGTIRRNTIGGMLGGVWTMNSRFLGANNFTAPVIAAVTNPTYIGTVLKNVPKAFVKPIIEASKEVPLLGRAMAGGTTGAALGAVVGGFPGAAVGAAVGATALASVPALANLGEFIKGTNVARWAYGAVPDFVKPSDYVISSSGKIFTDAELTRVFQTNVYKMSQYDFDFGSALLQDVKRAAEINEAGHNVNIFEQLRRGFGPLTRNSSFWNIVGSQADYVFREAVFKEALVRGSTEAEAANLAKNTLLDYSKISTWERKLISSWVMFYSFMRQSTFEAVLGLGRPKAASVMVKSAIVQKGLEDQYLKSHNAYVAKYAGTRMYSWTNDTTYDGYKTGFYGFANPMADAYTRVAGGIYATIDAYIKGEMFATGVGAVYEMATQQPHVEYAKQIAELVSPYNNAPNGYFPSAMIVTATQTGLFDYMKTKYDLQPVKDKDGAALIVKKGEPTYGGYQWTFGSKEGKIAFLTDSFLMTSFGAERSLKDWAAATAIANGEDPKNAELKKNKEGNWVLYLAGAQTTMASPEWITAQEELARQLSRELAAAKAGKGDTPIERFKMTQE